jgi:thioredoxin-dependent peroxiredoxin
MSAGDAAGTAEPPVTGADDRAGAIAVRVGDPIPSIGLRASDGYLLNLRSFVTRQPAAFLFFAAPTADGEQRRRGTQVAESLAAAREQFAAAEVAVVGVTCDNERQQAAWIEEQGFPYLLFSDERRSAVHGLGIPVSRDGDNMNVERPVLLVVGRDGLLRAVLHDPDPDYAADIVLAAVRRAEGLDPEPSAPAEPSS